MGMEAEQRENPKILVPYSMPDLDSGILDFFVYLRPETNGVDVESTIFSVIRTFGPAITLQYLANLPGEYVAANRIVERHYQDRVFFARHGAKPFTVDMRRQFEEFFREPFDPRRVVGAFDALAVLNIPEMALFALRVPEECVVHIAGQIVKKIGDVFVVNYDIPAILNRNHAGTDIAVMVFRTTMDYRSFFEVVSRMRLALIDRHLVSPERDLSRAVHVTRSPFEQLKDARDYLIAPDGTPMGVTAGPFARFLLNEGFSAEEIFDITARPICSVRMESGALRDVSMMDFTQGQDYQTARDQLSLVEARIPIPD